ncbi:MAG: energy-coupling factor ABC transporter substrate-binding protein [Marinifilaceae bacterium]|jgi:cobalt transport protein|nr:energy-coupling factor ABC transporter substrate-binding protein [Marinifilaceae bacterium]
MKKKTSTVWIVLAVVLVIGIQIAAVNFFPNHEGTDDQSVSLIESIAPDYIAWYESPWSPESDITEQALFLFQLLIGLGIFTLYVIKQRKKKTNKLNE